MISLCLIVKNEGKHLRKLLKRYVDEIVIVDTGSTDKTVKLAAMFTNKVFSYKWNDDFSKARNYSIKKATKDWILVMDPDEKIKKEDLTKLRKLTKEAPGNILGYRLIQKTYYKNRLISTRGICRLFRNNRKIRFIYPIHETVRESIKSLGGKIAKSGIIIRNYPKLSKEKSNYYLKLLKKKAKLFPQSNYQKEIELENYFASLH